MEKYITDEHTGLKYELSLLLYLKQKRHSCGIAAADILPKNMPLAYFLHGKTLLGFKSRL